MFEQRSGTVMCLMQWGGGGLDATGRPGEVTRCVLGLTPSPFLVLTSPLSWKSSTRGNERGGERMVSCPNGRGRAANSCMVEEP